MFSGLGFTSVGSYKFDRRFFSEDLYKWSGNVVHKTHTVHDVGFLYKYGSETEGLRKKSGVPSDYDFFRGV